MSITFEYNQKKAQNAALWLLRRHGEKLPSLKLIKLAFLADREHLACYGRPIFAGCYYAMPHGPVASEFYNELKLESESKEFKRYGTDIYAVASVDEDFLSASDVEVLEEIDDRFGRLDEFALEKMTHEFKAWSKNYKEDSDKKSFPLPYEDFFLDLDPQKQKNLDIIQEDNEVRAALK